MTRSSSDGVKDSAQAVVHTHGRVVCGVRKGQRRGSGHVALRRPLPLGWVNHISFLMIQPRLNPLIFCLTVDRVIELVWDEDSDMSDVAEAMENVFWSV